MRRYLRNGRDFHTSVKKILEGFERLKGRSKEIDIEDDRKDEIGKIGRALKETSEYLEKFVWFKNFIHDSELPIAMMDKELQFVDCNSPVAKILGYECCKEFLSQEVNILDVSPLYQPDGRDSYEKAKELIKMTYEKGYNKSEWRYCKKDGEGFCVEIFLIPVIYKTKELLYCIWRDLTKEKEIYHQSITDSLTGVYNRWYFLEKLENEMERIRRKGGVCCLIMIDIDHFKSVNDRFGHNIGDKVLQHLVNTVKNRLRKMDTFARWGGEEFVIVLPDTFIEDAVTLAEELRITISQMKIPEVGYITASFGVGQYCDGDTIESLIERVDKMMYKAKHEGRNCVRWTDECH